MSTYFALLTEVGEAKLANAVALGRTLKLASLAVGDGNGNLPMPDRKQKALVREVRRAGLNQLTVDPANASQIIVEQVLPEDVGGWWIREIGIFDDAGDLCAVANCPPSYKPLMLEGSGRTQVVRVVLIVSSTAAIELKIDPSVILATRKYVDDQDITVRAYSDAQLAKHLTAADPHPLLAKIAYVDQQDASARAYGDQQLAKHLAAADPHPLLAKIAYVDQQDASARTYGDQQLAGHLNAADPHPQYSMKTVATPPKFDASSRLVNAEFVQQAQGNMARYRDVLESRTLTAEDMGCALYFPYGGKILTIPTPESLGIPPNSGKCVKFFGLANAGTLVAAPGVNIGFDVGMVQSITIKVGQYLTLMETGVNVWQVIDSTAEMWRNVDFANYFNNVAPTPQKFSSSNQIATAEFVRQEMGSLSGFDSIRSSRAITPDDIGKCLWFQNVGFKLTLTRPDELIKGGPLLGRCIKLMAFGGINGTIAPASGVVLAFDTAPVGALTLKTGQTLTLVSASESTWQVIDSTAEMGRNADFASALAINGYQKIAGGMIIQKGQVLTNSPSEFVRFNFPIQFPGSGTPTVIVSPINGGTLLCSVWHGTPTASYVDIKGSEPAMYIDVIAIGY